MSPRNELNRAVQILKQGERRAAEAILLTLDAKITDPATRLEYIDAALSALDPLNQCQKLCDLALEGIRIAQAGGQEDIAAYLMARRAQILMTKVVAAHHGMRTLKLSPSWSGFATESDQRQFDALAQERQEHENEVDDLFRRAASIAERIGSPRIRGYILMVQADITSTRYLQEKTDLVREPLRAKAWLRWGVLKYPLLERILVFGWRRSKRLAMLSKKYRRDFLGAASLFKSCNDPLEAQAYYNLANQLRSGYRFGEARRFLKRARVVAERHGDQWVMRQSDRLKEILKKRNRDIPNYLAGERRDQIE